MLWESTQKARRSHTCDLCSDWIYPGDTYNRIVMRAGNRLEVFREHRRPDCPVSEYELEVRSTHVESAAVVMLEVKMVAVVKIQLNGEPITEFEPQLVTSVVSEPPDDGDDVDIPF